MHLSFWMSKVPVTRIHYFIKHILDNWFPIVRLFLWYLETTFVQIKWLAQAVIYTVAHYIAGRNSRRSTSVSVYACTYQTGCVACAWQRGLFMGNLVCFGPSWDNFFTHLYTITFINVSPDKCGGCTSSQMRATSGLACFIRTSCCYWGGPEIH